MKLRNHQREAAMTLPEVLVAVLLLAIFFSSIFEVNGVCLRLVNASKQSVAALESVHDRCETLRNVAFTDLINVSYVQNLVSAPANASDFCKNATEVIKISAYPVANGVTQFTRSPNGGVTTDSTATDLGSTLVQVSVSTSWNMALGGRAQPPSFQTEQKMKLTNSQRIAGFSLSENLVSLGLSSIVLAAAVASGVSLQKSLNAVDNYFATQMQQVRIIDYLNRNVGTRGDSLLRKIDFNYDHFIATYGPNGDNLRKAIVPVSKPQITRRVELVAAPVTPFEAGHKNPQLLRRSGCLPHHDGPALCQ
jgi:type II secretory pathway pseudopilin PulG